MRPKKVAWTLFVVSASLFGCTTIQDLSEEGYRRGVLTNAPLTRDEVGVFPMWALWQVRAYQGAAESIFVRALSQMRPASRWMDPTEVRRRLEVKGVEGTYRSVREADTAGEVAREEDIRRVGRALQVRYLLQTTLTRVEVIEGATQVQIQAKMWDVEMGDVVWEGTGEARGYLFLIFPQTPSSFEKTVEVASRGLIRKLP